MTGANELHGEEDKASETLFPELKDHLNYANDVYNFAFKVQEGIGGKNLADIQEVARSQFIVLMRITDFLRSVQLLAIKGYPEQAGALVASIFELAHSAMYFSHSPDSAKAWLEADSIDEEMPWHILGGSWKKTVATNCEKLGGQDRAKLEYQVYRQLCWMKHSLPKMQDMRVESDGVSLVFGPYTDERAINHAWFSLEHAGRLTESVISLLKDEFGNADTTEVLDALTARRDELRKRAIERFGQENPFESEASE